MNRVFMFFMGLCMCNVLHAQTLDVYVIDSIYTKELLTVTSADSVEGKVVYTYANHGNALAYEANYYNRYITGFIKYFYPTGQLMATCVYQKSKKNGEYSLYDLTGKLVLKGVYVNNVKDGYWVYKNYAFMGNYKNGLKHGKWRCKLPDGTKQNMFFKHGVLVRKPKQMPFIPNYILMDGVTKL